jgi:RNA polymerase sigma-70 factor (ECF subfamily)
MNDAQLVRAVQSGDEAALETLYERYLPSVWRFACSQLAGDLNAAEDVVSETFLAAVRQIGRIDPDGGAFIGWLTGIARHKVADVRRGRIRIAAVDAADLPDDAAPIQSAGPPAAAEAAEARASVRSVMAAMDDQERLALEWKYIDGLSVREMADRLGRTEKAVESVLFRARAAFRTLFERRTQADSA